MRPRFRDSASISFADRREEPDDTHDFGQDSLYELDLLDRKVREILRLPADLRGYDWSPDARLLAYQISTRVKKQGKTFLASVLCLFDSTRGKTEVIRPLGISIGTHTTQGDEQTIAWSPTGDAVLIVDTHQSPSVYVTDARGHDLVRPWEGTFARWLPDGRTALFREPDEPSKRGSWLTLDVKSGQRRALKMPAGTFRPVVSPDGAMVAFDDGDPDEPSVFVYKWRGSTSRRVIRGYGAAVWLSAGVVAATAGGPCPQGTECSGWWEPLKGTVGVDIGSDQARSLELHTTLQETHLFSVIDVLIPPTK